MSDTGVVAAMPRMSSDAFEARFCFCAILRDCLNRHDEVGRAAAVAMDGVILWEKDGALGEMYDQVYAWYSHPGSSYDQCVGTC